MGRLSPGRARWLTLRAHLALLAWLLLAGGLAVLGLVLVILSLAGVQPAEAGLAGLGVLWLGGYVVACEVVVWSYRRTIGPLVASGLPADGLRAEARAQVRMQFVGSANLVGVDVGHQEPTRLADLVNSSGVLVAHVGTIGLLLIAAARAG